MTILPYVAAIAISCLPLAFVATRDRTHALTVACLTPLLLSVALVVIGFFWTSARVADCDNCESSLSLFGFDIFTTTRVDGGYGLGSVLGPVIVLGLGVIAAAALVVATRGRAAELSTGPQS